jgi:hypothetical protein
MPADHGNLQRAWETKLCTHQKASAKQRQGVKQAQGNFWHNENPYWAICGASMIVSQSGEKKKQWR